MDENGKIWPKSSTNGPFSSKPSIFPSGVENISPSSARLNGRPNALYTSPVRRMSSSPSPVLWRASFLMATNLKNNIISQLRIVYGLGFQHCIFSLRIINDCPTRTPQIFRTSNRGRYGDFSSKKKHSTWVRSQNPRFLSRSKG